MINELLEKRLKYNCSYYEIKSKIYSNLLIVFTGCNEFFITNNFLGCVAIGKRNFDFDKETANYTYKLINNSVHISRIELLIKTYEKERLNLTKTNIKRVESLEGLKVYE